MNLRSLKKAVKVKDRPEEVTDYEEEKYPYGTRIDLNDESLKALKIKIDDFEIGESVMVVGKAEVIRISKSASKDYDNKTLELQITDMDVKSIGGLSLTQMKMSDHDYS